MSGIHGAPPAARIRRRWARTTLAVVPLALLLLCIPALGCSTQSDGETPAATAGEADAQGGETEAVELDPTVLDHPSRPDEDVVQDEGRQPLQVYEFVGIRPGMTVADVFPGGGYNTHLLSLVVGDEGKVFSVLEFYGNKELFDGRLYRGDVIQERIDTHGLDNVEMVDHLEELEPASVEAMVAIRNYHDVEWVFDGMSRADTVAAMYRALEPGGVVGIVEVDTDREGWDQETHRLDRQVVIDDFTAGGFEHAGSSEMLDNPEDDHSETGFEEGRHTMDRYLLKFRKPESEGG